MVIKQHALVDMAGGGASNQYNEGGSVTTPMGLS
jgi:hypothetical protein